MRSFTNHLIALLILNCFCFIVFQNEAAAQSLDHTNYFMKFLNKTTNTPTYSLLYEQNDRLFLKPSVSPLSPALTAKFTIDATGTNEPALKLIGNPTSTSVPALKISGYNSRIGIETSGSVHILGMDNLNISLLTEGNIFCNGSLSVDRMDNENNSILSIGAIKAPKVTTNLVYFGDANSPGNFYTCSRGFDFYVRDPNRICSSVNIVPSYFDNERTLRITHGRLEVLGTVQTYGFQLLQGAGRNKVLTSDETGIASWTDITALNDNDWIRTASNDLYSNCRNVGIGIQVPTKALDVVGDIALSGGIFGKSTNNKLTINGSSANANAGLIEIGDGSAFFNYVSINAPGPGGLIRLWAGGNQSMTIRSNEVLFGNSTDNLINLKVNGKIYAMEVKVSLDRWSDIVFADDYCLMPLKDVDSFIKVNKHLPEIPSEKEVLENGINVGEMNAILLKKIEELTLYIIDQQKQIDELKVAISK